MGARVVVGLVDDPSAKMSLPLPRRFGNYTLLKTLSRGGMGDVFLARRSGLEGAERLCVIKTVRADMLAEHEYLGRFLDEARLVVTLTHAGICHVFDAGRVDQVMYLAMEHIAGVTLRDVIDALLQKPGGTTIPLGHGLWIILELLDALDYAHAHAHPETGLPLRVVHRDISPQNVMVSFDGEVKLIDFGLASSGLKVLQTGEDHVMGKIAYMAPEQVQGQKLELDGRVDEYAAAIVAYELLCGERYYGDKDNAQVTRLVAAGGFRPPKMRQLPAGVYAVLDKALAPERGQRFATCGAMANALRVELAIIDPLMARSAMRTWIQRNLAEVVQAHRTLVRTLPTSPPAETKQTNGDTKAAHDTKPAPRPITPDSDSQKAMVLEAPKTEQMLRPTRGADPSSESGSSPSIASTGNGPHSGNNVDEPRTDEDKRPGSDEPATDKDFRAPAGVVEEALEIDAARAAPKPAAKPAPFMLSSVSTPVRSPSLAGPLSTGPQGTSGAASASRTPLVAAAATIAIAVVAVIAVVAWLLTH